MVNGEEREQFEDANDQGRNHIPAGGEGIPDPNPFQNQPANEGKGANNPICP